MKIWCLHGAVGSADDWVPLAEGWTAAGHEVQRVDLWGFLEEEGMALAEFGAVLNAEVRRAGENARNILVGYSMGGRLGLHALVDDPGLWSRAVLVSAHPGLFGEEERILRMARDAEWAALALTAG